MRITRRRAHELPINLSPITPKGSIIYSRIQAESDPEDPTKQYIVEYTPDGADAIKVLKFLDEMNGIGWTGELRTIEQELREALHDLMAVKVAEDKE